MGYDGKIRVATEGRMQMHLAERTLGVAFKNGQVINSVDRGHIAFRMDDLAAFLRLRRASPIPIMAQPLPRGGTRCSSWTRKAA